MNHASPPGYRIVTDQRAPEAVDVLLRLLPNWFGIEASIVEYVEDAKSMETYLAVDGTDDVQGVLLANRHSPVTAEMHLLAVHPEKHRLGIGKMLVDAFEADMRALGTRLFEVKTQGPSLPNEHYAQTLDFYLALGYLPLEELNGYWPEVPCLILVKAAG